MLDTLLKHIATNYYEATAMIVYGIGFTTLLLNRNIIKKIIELGDVQPSDHVLEVGPGIGTLTAALLKCAGHVTSIEMDYDLPAVLTDTLDQWEDRFTLLRMNALERTD